MEKLGVVGFEPGGGGLASRVNEIKQALNGRNIKVSSYLRRLRFILSTDPAIRKECMDTMKEIIAAWCSSGSTGVIIVPAFNGQVPALPHTMETSGFPLRAIQRDGNLAAQHGTTSSLNLEPKRVFLSTSSSRRRLSYAGISIIRVYVACGRLWHMTWEETSDMGSLYLRWRVSPTRTRGQPQTSACRVRMEMLSTINGFK